MGLPSSCAKVFPDADRVVAAPRTVGAEVGLSEIAAAGAKAIKQEVLCHPHLKSLPHVDGGAPGMFDTDSIR